MCLAARADAISHPTRLGNTICSSSAATSVDSAAIAKAARRTPDIDRIFLRFAEKSSRGSARGRMVLSTNRIAGLPASMNPRERASSPSRVAARGALRARPIEVFFSSLLMADRRTESAEERGGEGEGMYVYRGLEQRAFSLSQGSKRKEKAP